MTFSGFPDAGPAFYEGLEADNSKTYWLAHKAVYESAIREPMLALVDALEGEFGEARLFRPYRDVRFSADKSPYKTHQGAFTGADTAFGYYVQMSADGLALGGGFRATSTAVTARYRAAVDASGSGLELEAALAPIVANGFEVLGDAVATAPRGYPRDHPRIELLRRKELLVIQRLGMPDWVDTPGAADQIAAAWRSLQPLRSWVDRHVFG